MMGTVLVVDDDRAMTKTICAILGKRGWDTLQAFNGEEAVTAAARQSLSAVLMDVMMPGMNGVEAYRRIRDLQPATSVLLMTAHATQELLEQAMREGVTTVFSKPIQWPELMTLLEELRSPPRGVLLVDDHSTYLALLADVLRDEGTAVRQADSLCEALSILRQHAGCRPRAVSRTRTGSRARVASASVGYPR